jgi:uncharacterized protein (UPF0261 family)
MAIAVVGMLDEREEALKIIRDRIEENGHRTLLLDISVGTGGIIPTLRADVRPLEILGSPVAGSRNSLEAEGTLASLMAQGLARVVSALHTGGRIDGIIAIAGMTGSLISLKAMKLLPFGFPKVLISSAAAMPAHAAQLAEYFGCGDITVMHAVVDTVGINGLVRSLALNGANAVCGMVDGRQGAMPKEEGPSIALTEFGLCDRAAEYVREMLSDEYEMISFHATGLSDMAARDLVVQGRFRAFIDLVPGTFVEYLLGGNRPSGPDRLDIASDRPIPYVFCPGGFDLLSCGPLERKEKGDRLWETRGLARRKLHVQDALRVQARTSPEELAQVAIAAAERLNRYANKSLMRVILPLRGFSSLSVESAPLHDPEGDAVFIRVLKERIDPAISVIEVDTDINSREFARVVAASVRDAMATADRSPG